uniref:CRAL-TRIO domain-containing protein n=1 Tax=Aureoumbra lagunensis TaxID=44058 RepID=A0A7S3JMS8_9STRA
MYADAAWTNLVINAPGIVRYTWRIIERIIDDETRDIVRFVPVGNAGIHALTQELPQSIIPRYLGGSGGNLELMLADFMDKDFTLDQSVRQVNEEARQGLDDDNEDDVEFVQDTTDLLSATWDLVNAEHSQQNTLRSRRHHVHHTKPENTNTIELDLIEDHSSIDHTHGNYRPRAASIDCTPPRSPDRIAVFALIRLVTDFLRIYEFFSRILVATFLVMLRYLQPRRNRRITMTPSGFYIMNHRHLLKSPQQ